MKKNLSITIFLTSILSIIITLLYYENFPNGYSGMIFLPITYLFIFFLFYYEYVGQNSNPFVVYGILGIEWIRFVLLPPFCAIAGNDNGMTYINPSIESLKLSIWFMIIEFIGISIVIKLFIKKIKPLVIKDYKLIGNRLIYGFFILISFIIYFIFAKDNELIRFIIIDVGEGQRIGDTSNIFDLIVRQFILCSFILLFVILAHYFWEKYKQTEAKRYFYYSLIVALINVSIIVGERRSAQVYAAICTIWILNMLFPKFKKIIALYILTMVITVLFFMSVYKFFGAFLYNSYSEALKNSEVNVGFIAKTLQSYFFGPENIAISIDFFNNFDTNLFQLFYDFCRSIFGLNFIFKIMGTITSISFNTYVYGFPQETGHVLSSVGYSYGFFGPLLLPLISSINVLLSIYIENVLYKTRSLEIVYILLYILARFVTNLFVNTPPLISQSTLMGGTYLLIVFVAYICNIKNKGRSI